MFQYAFGKAYAQKNECGVWFDTSWFEEGKQKFPRPLQLPQYNVTLPLATKEEVAESIGKRRASYLPGFLRKLFKKKKYETNIPSIGSPGGFEESLLDRAGSVYFEGYFQTELYFKEIRKQLLSDFSLKAPLNESNQYMFERINQTNSIALHIRRGDYLNLQHIYPVCSMEYYRRAIEQVASSVDDPHFFIFSDDPKWVRKEFHLVREKTVVDINGEEDGVFDIELMRHCQHNIIANSSFSWWGAWLNENPNKIVIAPRHWFGDGRDEDIIPNSWVKS